LLLFLLLKSGVWLCCSSIAKPFNYLKKEKKHHHERKKERKKKMNKKKGGG